MVGLGLLVAAYAPLHRLLDPTVTGLAGAATRASAEAAWSMGVWGTLSVFGAAAALAVLVRGDPARWVAPALRAAAAVPPARFAAGAALLAGALSALVARVVLRATPTSVDEMVQLLHARALLAGTVAMPLPGDPAAWMVQNSLLTPSGWVSVYPPLHTLALAAGHAVGAAWLVGPLAAAATAGLSCLAFCRLLPARPALARVAGGLVAVAPFAVFLGATHLSHTTAAALVALALWTAARARDGGAAWGLLTGAAVGAAVCARPWAGVALGFAVVLAVWAPRARSEGATWTLSRAVAMVVGGGPFALLLFAWNRSLFGSPLTLGYTAAYGPAHGLGLHADPWGNAYGIREALAYTGSDITHLGVALFESPLPAVGAVGIALVLARRLPLGLGPALAWVLAGLGANAVYWHHGLHMGPRMLYETIPAWAALWAWAASDLGGPGSRLPPPARRMAAWAALLSLVGGVALAPARAAAYRPAAGAAAGVSPPRTPALVFAHGSWASRVGARLAASGMRRDSVETALRRNDLCAVDAYARWRAAGAPGEAPRLDFQSRPGPAPALRPVQLSPGNTALVDPRASPSPACLEEARADRLGTVELEPLLWRYPPLPGAAVVVARDLGPWSNAAVLAAFPEATPFVLLDGGPDGPRRILTYGEGMEVVWGGAGALSGDGG